MPLSNDVALLCTRIALGINYGTSHPESWAEYVFKDASEERKVRLVGALNEVLAGRHDKYELETFLKDHFRSLGVEFEGEIPEIFKKVHKALISGIGKGSV